MKIMKGVICAAAVLLGQSVHATTINFVGTMFESQHMGQIAYPPFPGFNGQAAFTASFSFDGGSFVCSTNLCSYSGESSFSVILDNQYHLSSLNHNQSSFEIAYSGSETELTVRYRIKPAQSDWEIAEGTSSSSLVLRAFFAPMAVGTVPDFFSHSAADYAVSVQTGSPDTYVDGEVVWNFYGLEGRAVPVGEVPLPPSALLFGTALLGLARKKFRSAAAGA